MLGILFTPENIRLTVQKLKTVTRRLDGLKEINKEPDEWIVSEWHLDANGNRQYRFDSAEGYRIVKPRYHAGETVYLKEGWRIINLSEERGEFDIEYKIDNTKQNSFCITEDFMSRYWEPNQMPEELEKWRSPMFLPEAFARHFLRIKSARPERLLSITNEDSIREGVGVGFQMNSGYPDYQHIVNGICELTQDTARLSYFTLWDAINGKRDGGIYKSERNPWLWRNEYELIEVKKDDR